MAKISRETTIEHLANIAIHYLVSYKESEAALIEDYGGNDVKRDLKDLEATCDRDLKRIEYLKNVIEERSANHDAAEPAEPTERAAADRAAALAVRAAARTTAAAADAIDAAAAADAAARTAATAADAANLIQHDGTGTNKQA